MFLTERVTNQRINRSGDERSIQYTEHRDDRNEERMNKNGMEEKDGRTAFYTCPLPPSLLLVVTAA